MNKNQLKFDLKIKLSAILTFVSILSVFAKTDYTKPFIENVPLAEVIEEIEATTNYRFLYNTKTVDLRRNVSFNSQKGNIENVLDDLFNNSDISYKINNTHIILKQQNNTNAYPDSQLTSISSQQLTINGTVLDSNGQPLPGANIIEKNTKNGVQSDFDGHFSISISNTEATLVISYVGFVTQEVTISGATTLSIVLNEDAAALDEVVVIGYGTVKKRDLTGAVSSVKSEDIQLAPVVSPLEAIQGRVAGLDISRSDGRAGSGMKILLRGNRSLTASSEPIYIIDGIQGNVNNLNPNDIASIDVLKDASSTAIYGSAGANGVIIITTKKGEAGKIQVDFNTYISINDNPSYPSALQGNAWLNYLEEGYRAKNGVSAPDRDALFSGWGLSNNLYPYIDSSKYVDWVDQTFRTGLQTNNTLSIRGGTEKLQGSFSLGQNKTEGIYPGDDISVYTMRSDIQLKAKDWVNLGVVTGLTFKDQNTNRSRVNKALGEIPLGDIYKQNGEINQYPINGEEGIVSVLSNNIPGTYVNNNKSTHLTINPYAEFTLANNLTFKTILGVTLSNSRRGEFKSDHTYLMLTGSETAERSATYSTAFNYNYNWENILNYNITLADDHELGATFITSYANNQSETSFNSSSGFISDNSLYFDINAGINNRFLGSGYSMKNRSSYAGRFNYNYKGKYLLTGSIRTDGASQLSNTQKWDVFPAGAIAWRISDEGSMRNIDWLSDLKLRVGYGVSGNSNIDSYSTLSGVVSGQDQLNLGGGQLPTYVPSKVVGNDLLGWEKSYNLNLGLDFGLFRNRVYGSLEFYDTQTKDIIYGRGLPSTVGGFGPKDTFIQNGNIAEMSNKGIELTLSSKNISTKDFQWSTTFTFSRNKEEVGSVDLGNVSVQDMVSLGLFVGSPKDVYYDYKKIGIWQLGEEADAAAFGLLPGDVKIESSLKRESEGIWVKTITDNDGNTTVEQYSASNPYSINQNDDRQIIGHAVPDWTAGLQNTITYKKFDLTIFATARYGQTIDGQLLGYFKYGNNNIPENYNYWTPTNPTNDYPRPYISRSTSHSVPVAGLNFVDGSYFKIKNITLGYELPENITNTLGLTHLRAYSTMYNSLIITKSHLLKGLDPETNASDSFPLFRQLVFGLNISF